MPCMQDFNIRFKARNFMRIRNLHWIWLFIGSVVSAEVPKDQCIQDVTPSLIERLLQLPDLNNESLCQNGKELGSSYITTSMPDSHFRETLKIDNAEHPNVFEYLQDVKVKYAE